MIHAIQTLPVFSSGVVQNHALNEFFADVATQAEIGVEQIDIERGAPMPMSGGQ